MITYRDLAADIKTMIRILFALAAVAFWFFLYCQYADACQRCGLFGNRCRFQQHHHVQKVIAAPIVNQQVYYFVGQPIRADAIIQKAMNDDPQYQSFLQYKQNLAAIQAQKEAPAAPEQVQSILAKKCASCHSGPTPPKGVLLDGTAPISPLLAERIDASVKNGSMPKDRPHLTPEEKKQLALELSLYLEEWFLKEE